MEVSVDAQTLEKEIQRVFKQLPGIVCDTASLLYIFDTLDRRFEKDFGRKLSTNY